MSAKKNRAWFICPRWQALIADHFVDEGEAARALHTDAKVLAKLRSQTPVAKSTALKMLRRVASQHRLGALAEELVVDTRTR